MRHWTETVAWWREGHLAYAKGLEDGATLGREQAYREIFAAFSAAIGTSAGIEFQAAMADHIRRIEQAAARRAWDTSASTRRAGDYTGRKQ